MRELHEGEDGVVFEFVSGHKKGREGGGRCYHCWGVGFKREVCQCLFLIIIRKLNIEFEEFNC